jgi:hypothetical protein
MYPQRTRHGIPVQYGENENGPGWPEHVFSIVLVVGLFFLGRYVAQRGER